MLNINLIKFKTQNIYIKEKLNRPKMDAYESNFLSINVKSKSFQQYKA